MSTTTTGRAKASKILLVINGLDFGGTETALAQLALQLKGRGYDVCVLSLKSLARLGKRLQEDGVRVETLGMDESVGVLDAIGAVRAFARMLAAEHFDVVHSFLPRANIVSRIANRLSGSKTAHISSERSTDFQRSKLVCKLNTYTARWTDRVLAVSPIVRDVLIQREHIPAGKISILSNGMDLDALDAVPPTDVRHELGLARDTTLLCSVGRLVHDKGHVYLVRAMRPLRERWPNLHLVLVGEGPEDSRIIAEAEEHDLGDRVHLLGFRSDVVGIMKGTDVFCLPSLEEGMPVTVLEAMACARPVIAADVGGVANLITSGKTGIIVPPAEIWTTMEDAGGANGSSRSGDGQERTRTASRAGIEALTQAIDTMMSDDRERDRLARAGRRFIEEHYTLDRVLALLEEHYGAVATNGHAVADGNRT